ncbi:ATP synthase assembly factor FMC1 mitochondrial [Echinococcus multilocularis]|uniref:Protein FMC1 homolog n=1 Tax=Echinococcus multilocularis TaxID=6211 RepID=A0A068Y9N2_ECHMU|nr:ATP synthase assembly factor FMC1 mitochondrial [Echinococcus multilocularis]
MTNIALLRSLLKELRKCSSAPQQQFTQSPFYKYILSQFRRFDTTTEQQCSPKHESIQVAETYLTLLKAVARHRQLVNTYKCREKTVSEAAKLVGLSLPATYFEEK